ncbi:MAG: hypothetical protein DMD61_07350 [Gemmatimonadetes bacterium]|nr:MAG: hypothetical protein DMD61_07350 [Gemmatimonadota bacterium]
MRRRWRRVSGAGARTRHPSRLPSHRVNYSLTPSTARPGLLPEHPQHRILLVGDPAARPDGLERFLVRGGFQVTEAANPPSGPERAEPHPPDLVVVSIGAKEAGFVEAIRELATAGRFAGAPVIALLADGGAAAVAEALEAGASDAIVTPVHFGELRARIEADLRRRADQQEARDALRTRDLLFDIFQEVSAALRADEIFQTLVRRVGHAFGLTHCSFVLTAPGEDKGRVVAGASSGSKSTFRPPSPCRCSSRAAPPGSSSSGRCRATRSSARRTSPSRTPSPRPRPACSRTRSAGRRSTGARSTRA